MRKTVTGALTVERYDQSQREVWDELVTSARARHFMFERAYMEYHADRFADASCVIVVDGQPLAAFPASRAGAEIVSHAGLTFGGLLSGSDLTAARTLEALEQVSSVLRKDGARRLVYKSVPHIYHVAPAEEDLFALHVLGARMLRRDVSAAIPPGARPQYTKGRRHAVGIGNRSGVSVAESDRVEEYMLLVAEVLRARHDVEPVHSPDEMRLLADRFRGQIRLFTATREGELIGGCLIYETPAVAHLQYSVVGPAGREIHAGDAIIDHLLGDVFAAKWFDFGISNDGPGALNRGLMRNKESFGARAVVYDQYVLELQEDAGLSGVH